MAHKDSHNEEWQQEAPILSSLDRSLPYEAPEGYFDELPGTIMDRIRAMERGGNTEIQAESTVETAGIPPEARLMRFRSLRNWSIAASIAILATIGVFWMINGEDNSGLKSEKSLEFEIAQQLQDADLGSDGLLDDLELSSFSENELYAMLGDEAQAALEDRSGGLGQPEIIDYLDNTDLEDFDLSGLDLDPEMFGSDI